MKQEWPSRSHRTEPQCPYLSGLLLDLSLKLQVAPISHRASYLAKHQKVCQGFRRSQIKAFKSVPSTCQWPPGLELKAYQRHFIKMFHFSAVARPLSVPLSLPSRKQTLFKTTDGPHKGQRALQPDSLGLQSGACHQVSESLSALKPSLVASF